jgi:hypothetical protein
MSNIIKASYLILLLALCSCTNHLDENNKTITFSCSNNVCSDIDARCALEVNEEVFVCSCGGCAMIMSGSDNIEDMDTYLPKVNKYWIDDAVWKQLAEKVLLKTGNEAFDVIKIESIITNETFTSLNYTYLDHKGKEEVAIIPMNIKM